MASLEDLSFETRDELARLARTLAENPDTRKDFLRLTKKAQPGLNIPELEIEESVTRHASASEARIQMLEAKLQEKDALAELDRRRQSLMKAGKIRSEDEIQEVEKVMLEKGITNHETAADYHRWMKEAAAPTASSFNMNVLDTKARDVLQGYWKNPQRAARDEAFKALAELRNPRRPIGL
jgi:hypothetical protein